MRCHTQSLNPAELAIVFLLSVKELDMQRAVLASPRYIEDIPDYALLTATRQAEVSHTARRQLRSPGDGFQTFSPGEMWTRRPSGQRSCLVRVAWGFGLHRPGSAFIDQSQRARAGDAMSHVGFVDCQESRPDVPAMDALGILARTRSH
jgi:hypothetical protein